MLGDVALYFANRVAGNAVDNLSRRIAWAGGVAVLLVCGLVFALFAAYAHLAPLYGSAVAAAMIAGGCLGVCLFALAVPWVLRQFKAAAEVNPTFEAEPLAAADEEARDAIDYFGAAKVMAMAFMFGFSAARQIGR